MNIAPLPGHPKAVDLPPERLATNSTLTESEKIAEASRQFEAILLRQILEATQKTVIQSKYADNSTAAGIYRDLITNQLADSISKSGGFGLAATFEHQLNRSSATDSEEGSPEGKESGSLNHASVHRISSGRVLGQKIFSVSQVNKHE